jgi:copper(I)-binding protein
MSRVPGALVAPALALVLALTGCQSSTVDDGAPAGQAPSGSDLTLTDPWVKAADSGMTAAFGTLVNATDEDITIVSARSAASPMELHEMATGSDGTIVMRPKDGGLVVPAGGSLTLAPGGEHLMFMDLTAPLEPGDEVDLTVVADDGIEWSFTAPVRTFAGAEEDYEGEAGKPEEQRTESGTTSTAP